MPDSSHLGKSPKFGRSLRGTEAPHGVRPPAGTRVGVFTLTDLSNSALVRRLTSPICRAAHPSVVSFRLSVVSSRRFVEQRTDLPFLLTDLSNSAPICRSFSPICRA
ncbi:MAG: hypothetical protein KIT77_27980, partial [Caldilinea sp.]|nr:hypothetical protein [Caldilineaceae bacterium]MCW5845126.1 hypothetical protein [Caldilinea sp.]